MSGGIVGVVPVPGADPIPVDATFAPGASMEVEGRAASGAAPVGNPVWVGGADGAAVRPLLVDASGRPLVAGAAADGAAVAGNPLLAGGSDGALARALRLDTSGRPIVVGAAAAGAAITGNPVLAGGSDGANAQALRVDTSGRQIVVGAAAPGALAAGNPLLIGGSDSVNARSLLMDSGGRPRIVGPVPVGGAVAGDPILLGLVDGANVVDYQRNNQQLVGLASAARTTTTDTADLTNFNGRGVQVILGVTIASGTGGLILQIQGKDPVSGLYYNLNSAPTAITTAVVRVYEVFPGVTATSGDVAQRTSGLVPRIFRIRVVHGDGTSYTYSVSVIIL